MSYANRVFDNGVSYNKQDAAKEEKAVGLLESVWDCRIERFGGFFNPIDFYAYRHDRMVAFIEFKQRSHVAGKYPTVFLNVRKYLHLVTASHSFFIPSMFVVGFSDCYRYIDVSKVNATNQRIGGCNRRYKGQSDIEPVIEVPVGSMVPITPP